MAPRCAFGIEQVTNTTLRSSTTSVNRIYAPAFVVLHHVDELRVAQGIRARPEAGLVVVQNGPMVTLKELLPS